MNIRKWRCDFSTDCDNKYQSESTRKTYKHCLSVFLYYFNKYREPKEIPTREIKEWLLAFEAINTRKQMLCSIKAFYILTVGMPKKINIPYPKKEKSLPKVIDKDFLIDKISEIENLKHKAIISIGYSIGLRVSEVVNLRIEDIDSNRMIVHIKNAKGRKDRILPLSHNMLNLLRSYFLEHKPSVYLFNGQFKNKYSATSINKIVKKYLGNQYHFHQLRHSCATAMLEAGTDISLVQKMLGHTNIKTTMIYTHVSNQLLQKISTPI